MFRLVLNNYTILEAGIRNEIVKDSYAIDLNHIFVIQCFYYCLRNVCFALFVQGKNRTPSWLRVKTDTFQVPTMHVGTWSTFVANFYIMQWRICWEIRQTKWKNSLPVGSKKTVRFACCNCIMHICCIMNWMTLDRPYTYIETVTSRSLSAVHARIVQMGSLQSLSVLKLLKDTICI